MRFAWAPFADRDSSSEGHVADLVVSSRVRVRWFLNEAMDAPTCRLQPRTRSRTHDLSIGTPRSDPPNSPAETTTSPAWPELRFLESGTVEAPHSRLSAVLAASQ